MSFTKLRFLRSFWGASQVLLSYDWFKSYDTKQKYFHLIFNYHFVQKQTFASSLCFCIFVFFVILFVPIKIQTWLTPQNDHLNLSFVKHKHVVGKKMARYGLKMAIYQLLFFLESAELKHDLRLHLRPSFDPIKILTR